MSTSIHAAVLGATGYVGGELLRLLANHPAFTMTAAVSESCAGKPVAATFANLAPALGAMTFAHHDNWLETIPASSDLALFSAAPHGASAAMIASALERAADRNLNVRVVDASADFRYADKADYEAVYGSAHGAPDLLSAFTCALPEHAASVATPHVGHPGCFATAVTLAVVPLLQSGLADTEVFVSATTGSTGSGRIPQPGTHHPERHSNMYAYKPLGHRHAPEIAALADAATGTKPRIHFVPHSGPFARGIYATVQARTVKATTTEQLQQVFADAYSDAPFIDIVDATPRLKSVVASNRCQIGVASNGDTAVVMSAIDNLVKGAAGGAMQWMNRLWELPETSGLTAAAPGWT